MPTIEVSQRELLQAVAQLSPPDCKVFVSEVLAMRAERAAPATISEAELLERIHHNLPDEVRRRYRELSAKVSEETISPEEHAGLLPLIDRVENGYAERVRALGQLAQLRHKSLDEVMRDLGIQAPSHE